MTHGKTRMTRQTSYQASIHTTRFLGVAQRFCRTQLLGVTSHQHYFVSSVLRRNAKLYYQFISMVKLIVIKHNDINFEVT